MARTQEEVSAEYTQTLARAGEKTYLIHIKSEEIETLSQEREKLLNKAKDLSREAWKIQQTPLPTSNTTEPTTPEYVAVPVTTETTTAQELAQ